MFGRGKSEGKGKGHPHKTTVTSESALLKGQIIHYSPKSDVFATTTGAKQAVNKERPCVIVAHKQSGEPIIAPITTAKEGSGPKNKGVLMKHFNMDKRLWLPVHYKPTNGASNVSVPQDTGYTRPRNAAVIVHQGHCAQNDKKCHIKSGYIWCLGESPQEQVPFETSVFLDPDRCMEEAAIADMHAEYYNNSFMTKTR